MNHLSHEPSEIRDSLADRVHFSTGSQFILRLIWIVCVTYILVTLNGLTNPSKNPLHWSWMSWIPLSCLGIFLLHSFERRVHLGAIVIDWTGVHTNWLLFSRMTSWDRIVEVGHGCLVLKDRTLRWLPVQFAQRSPSQIRESTLHRQERAEDVQRIGDALRHPIEFDDGLQLIPWSQDDYPHFERCFTDPEMVKFMRYSSRSSRRLLNRFRRILLCETILRGAGHFSIRLNQQVIGHFDWWICDGPILSIKIAYGILPEFRRRGYMTQVLSSFSDRAITLGSVAQVIAVCTVDNEGSRQLLKRVGFRRSDTSPDGLEVYSKDSISPLIR